MNWEKVSRSIKSRNKNEPESSKSVKEVDADRITVETIKCMYEFYLTT